MCPIWIMELSITSVQWIQSVIRLSFYSSVNVVSATELIISCCITSVTALWLKSLLTPPQSYKFTACVHWHVYIYYFSSFYCHFCAIVGPTFARFWYIFTFIWQVCKRALGRWAQTPRKDVITIVQDGTYSTMTSMFEYTEHGLDFLEQFFSQCNIEQSTFPDFELPINPLTTRFAACSTLLRFIVPSDKLELAQHTVPGIVENYQSVRFPPF